MPQARAWQQRTTGTTASGYAVKMLFACSHIELQQLCGAQPSQARSVHCLPACLRGEEGLTMFKHFVTGSTI